MSAPSERAQRVQQRLRLATSRLDDTMRWVADEDAQSDEQSPVLTRDLALALVEHTRALRDCFLSLLESGPRTVFGIGHSVAHQLRLRAVATGERHLIEGIDRLDDFAGSADDLRAAIDLCRRRGAPVTADELQLMLDAEGGQ
jgi:hypothetical protein